MLHTNLKSSTYISKELSGLKTIQIIGIFFTLLLSEAGEPTDMISRCITGHEFPICFQALLLNLFGRRTNTSTTDFEHISGSTVESVV
jgi:hypothetical protein